MKIKPVSIIITIIINKSRINHSGRVIITCMLGKEMNFEVLQIFDLHTINTQCII